MPRNAISTAILPPLRIPAGSLPAICRARGLTLPQVHARVADASSGDAQRSAIELAAGAELRSLASAIDDALIQCGPSPDPIAIARALIANGWRRDRAPTDVGASTTAIHRALMDAGLKTHTAAHLARVAIDALVDGDHLR